MSVSRIPTHRRPAARRGRSTRRCHVGSPYQRPRLRLVYSRRLPALPLGIHPALGSTLAFAAVSVTALAYAAVIDVANGIGAVARQLRTALPV
jgi:hypothetical protein